MSLLTLCRFSCFPPFGGCYSTVHWHIVESILERKFSQPYTRANPLSKNICWCGSQRFPSEVLDFVLGLLLCFFFGGGDSSPKKDQIVKGDRGGRLGEKGVGGVREAGEEGARSGIHKVAENRRKRDKLCNIVQYFAMEKMQRGGNRD